MKIGIISDTHDNVRSIVKAVGVFKKNGVSTIIHCGDVIAPITVQYFEGIPMIFVRGNNDGDVEHLRQKITDIKGKFFEDTAELTLAGKQIGVYHGQEREKLERMIASGSYDYMLTGHTHVSRDERVGTTRVLNPGAHYWNCENTIMILDIANDELEIIDIWQEEAEEI